MFSRWHHRELALAWNPRVVGDGHGKPVKRLEGKMWKKDPVTDMLLLSGVALLRL